MVISSLEEFKAQDIVKIDLVGKTSMADFMLIASGTSSRQIRAIAENTLTEIKKGSNVKVNIEGLNQGDWVLLTLVILLFISLDLKLGNFITWKKCGRLIRLKMQAQKL